MPGSPLLTQVVLGYSPLIDRERAIVATRLTVFPDQRDKPPDAAALLDTLLQTWPPPEAGMALTLRPVGAGAAAAAMPTQATPLLLNIASEPLLRAVLERGPAPHVMVEIPAFMACAAADAPLLGRIHEAGAVLVVKGRPATELPREVLPFFRHSLIELGEDRRDGAPALAGVVRTISHIQLGVRTRADVDAAFGRGAVAAIGWPLEDEAGVAGAGPDLEVIMELMQRVGREEPIDRLEATLRNDPQLAFRLIRYLNSAAFGLRVEIASFQHALMMLGYKKLGRWLSLLLASANQDPAMRPAMYAAVRRGLLMEELVRSSADPELRGEMFICGVFSLLDRMLGQPFDELLERVPVPDRVRQALSDGSGPFAPYLTLVRALESGVRSDVRDAADACFLGLAEVNAALLHTLAAARELD